MKLILLSLLLILAFAAPMGGGQLGGDGSCDEAENWHRFEAMKYSMRDAQVYHAGAAAQAEALGFDGESCAGWESDREPVSFALGFERPTGDKT